MRKQISFKVRVQIKYEKEPIYKTHKNGEIPLGKLKKIILKKTSKQLI